MTEERQAECGVAADAVQAGFGNSGHVVDGVAAEIRKVLSLEAVSDLLDRVEVRRIAGQAFNPEPVMLAGDPLAHASAAMRRQAVPDQHYRALLLELAQLAQELDQGLIVVGTRTELEDEMRVAAIRFVRQGASQ
jgi:hypothetical protein